MEGATDRKPLPPRALQNRVLVHDTAREVNELFRPMPDIALSRIVGCFTEVGARAMVTTLEASFDGDPFHMLAEWSGMASYESGARRVMTSWVIEHRAQVRTSYFCASNRIVEMGISVGAMAVSLVGVEAKSLSYPRWLDRLDEFLSR